MMQKNLSLLAALLLSLSTSLFAADLNVPKEAVAHTALSIGTTGEGVATFYLIGPAARVKRTVRLGDEVQLKAEEVQAAGVYTVILRAPSGTATRTFFVSPGSPAEMNFLAQPSRVPAGVSNVISGTAFVSDREHNMILTPIPVRFELAVEGAPTLTRTVATRDGVAWTRIDSSRRAGNAQFTASAAGVSVKRVVQQVASEPCNLRIHAQPLKNGVGVETDPVRDCGGNPVPDGTIVTFTATDPQGRSTVDAVVKKGIARATLPLASQATISVASGVVIGNEIHWGGGR